MWPSVLIHDDILPGMILGDTIDPHCQRDSSEWLTFSVASQQWAVQWGRFDAFGSPAYWVNQAIRGKYDERVAVDARGTDLQAETIFCVLGGYGVTAESGRAAFQVVNQLLAHDPYPDADPIEAVLREPLPHGLGRYRFPRQRASRIAGALHYLRDNPPPTAPIDLRDYLLGITGVGPKTAAWIVRNVTGSADLAIIDVWIARALTYVGISRPEWKISQHYTQFEAAFLQYADYGDVQPGVLDLCIWEQARTAGHSFFKVTQ